MANVAEAKATINTKGSDTLLIVAQAWAEAYHNSNTDVAISVNGGGSGVGIAALINGTVDIANASRPIKRAEFEACQTANREPI